MIGLLFMLWLQKVGNLLQIKIALWGRSKKGSEEVQKANRVKALCLNLLLAKFFSLLDVFLPLW